MTLKKVFVANRGEIAVRVIRACETVGAKSVLGVSAADVDTRPARHATQSICIGPGPSAQSYLNVDAIVTAAKGTGCDALHPGYGFLAENADLADACGTHGVRFIGPNGDTIRALGDKISARAIAERAGVPVVPGHDNVTSYEDALAAASDIGFPILLKAAAGGGGRGMQVVHTEDGVQQAYDTARAEARTAFGDDTIYVERYIGRARHVEVQILADTQGTVLHLGERDCTLQRRHQKVVEEGPATALAPDTIDAMRSAAVALAASVNYEGAGTVEFIYDKDLAEFFFLEVNTRIQVEHPVTEALTGIDLVAAQLRIAAGEPLGLTQGDIILKGHAIECRINAESALDGFLPSPGMLTDWDAPDLPFVRLDSHCEAGYTIPPFYDSMLGKLIVTGATRAEALANMSVALRGFKISGVQTTLPFLRALVDHPDFHKDHVSTKWVEAQLDDPDFLEAVKGEMA